VLSETKLSLDQIVRERAYLLWEKDGCPHDRSEEYWHAPMTSVYASVPTFFGDKRAVFGIVRGYIRRSDRDRIGVQNSFIAI
jgi:hypothetical protein